MANDGQFFNSSIQNDAIRAAGDFIIYKIKLYPFEGDFVDITNIRSQVNIYEDMFQNFLSGDITVLDTWDLPMLLPIIGEEKIEIEFRRPGTKNVTTYDRAELIDESKIWKYTFRVTAITDRTKVRDKTQAYKLHFVSQEFLANKTTKFSRAFKRIPYSRMVEIIFAKYLNYGNALYCEPTKDDKHFTFPYWTPARAINTIASLAKPDAKEGCSYLFYQNLDGFHFVTLEQLFEQKPIEKLLYQWHNVMLNGYNKKINEDVRNIENYGFAESFNVLNNINNGLYASRLITFDTVRQHIEKYDFDYKDHFKKTSHLSKEPFFTDGVEGIGKYMSRLDMVSTNKDHDKIDYIKKREPFICPFKKEESIQNRHAQFQQIKNCVINITVPGDSARQIGRTINFSMPNAASENREYGKKMEKYYTGKYLMTAVRHRFETNGYYNDIELVRDSINKKPENIDPIPIYKDLW